MKEKVLLLGADGYTGWPLALHLAEQGKKVLGVDNVARRECVKEIRSSSVTPIPSFYERQDIARRKGIELVLTDASDYDAIRDLFDVFDPGVVINLAQIPSAPYSMRSFQHAEKVTRNNIGTNLGVLWAMKETDSDAHLIKMGTAGEYGQPNIPIPDDGMIDIEYKGRKDTLPFPKQAGSFYHWSKVSESDHCRFAANIWGLRITDLMQGIIYGVHTDETRGKEKLITRFDADSDFGTVINRFVAQAISDQPITVYGGGDRKRGLLNLNDAMRLYDLYINNPPAEGEYRVFNQLSEFNTTINELAHLVSVQALERGFTPNPIQIPNPRVEKEGHYLDIEHDNLYELGFSPRGLEQGVSELFDDLVPYKYRVRQEDLPEVKWQKQEQQKV